MIIELGNTHANVGYLCILKTCRSTVNKEGMDQVRGVHDQYKER